VKNYALDSNIVSYYLKGHEKIIQKVRGTSTEKNLLIIPPMVYFEIKRHLEYINAVTKLKSFERLCQIHGIGVIDKGTLDIAADVYIQLRKRSNSITIDDGDLLIAAYCLQNDYCLVTNNTKHFKNIENLHYENWI
jgi:predicted nucleic acid-binding protein